MLPGRRFCRVFSKENFYPKTNYTYRLLFALRNFKTGGIKIENNARSNRIWWPFSRIRQAYPDQEKDGQKPQYHSALLPAQGSQINQKPFEKIKNSLKYSLEDFGREQKTA